MRRRRLLADERGFSLVFTLLTLVVTSVTVTAAVEYTTSNARSSTRSTADQVAYALAEAGLANGAAVLSKPSNNAMLQSTLPSSEPDPANPAHANYIAKYEGGTAKWWGVLTGSQWLMHGLGIVTDPSGKTAPVTRHATSTIKIQPTLTQNLNSNAWNYMFAKNTAAACDVTLGNSITVDVSMFILGDLCLVNSADIVKAAAPELTKLVVGQHVHLGNSSTIGSSGSPISEAQIAGGCRVEGVAPGTPGETWTSPCSNATLVYAGLIGNDTVVSDGGPVADFNFWYANAKPGPAQYCGTSSGISATAFESSGSTTMNQSAGTFNLTPAASYTCQFYDIPPASDLLGELSWNNTTKTLTVKGIIFIDGSATVSNGVVNRYIGQATLYLSGTFTIDGGSRLCGGVTGGNCDFAVWNPNTEMLGIIANGEDGSGRSVLVGNSAQFQGSLYATKIAEFQNSAVYHGPLVAGSFILSNSVVAYEFPTITSVPIGWPGNPTVYAEPQPPQNYSG